MTDLVIEDCILFPFSSAPAIEILKNIEMLFGLHCKIVIWPDVRPVCFPDTRYPVDRISNRIKRKGPENLNNLLGKPQKSSFLSGPATKTFSPPPPSA